MSTGFFLNFLRLNKTVLDRESIATMRSSSCVCVCVFCGRTKNDKKRKKDDMKTIDALCKKERKKREKGKQ